MSHYIVCLQGPAPWGFRLQGGKDFNMPLTISRLSEGGKAAQASIEVGDVVLSIDGVSTDGMVHLAAQNKIKACTGSLKLSLQRASPAPKPTATTVQKQTHASFKAGVNGHTPPVTTAKPKITSSINVPRQSKAYNTPINLYSSDTAHEVAEGQKRGLREGQSDVKQQNGSPRQYMASVQPDVHYHHNLSDQSKKRLMQDTEDWQPKTGTAQSRSFCILAQMTGTEHMGETTPANETNKKASGDAVDVPQPIGPATASVKPMSKMPGGVCHTPPTAAVSSPTFKPRGVAEPTKPTGWQATNSAANSSPKTVLPTAQVSPAGPSGWGSNSKAASVVISEPEPQDDNTLVQMAEHIPAGNRTPMCAHCNSIIRGPFLVAMGRSWHPEEFTCAYCSLSLAHIGFVEEKGSVYCEKCYEQFFAPECARCQRKILGEIINALKQTWHVNCFVCVACKQPIRNNIFHMEDGDPYCEKDYYNLFGTTCHGCDFPIEAGDKFLQALGHTWHDTCFVCAVCCTNLEGQTFFSKKDKLLCKKHAHTVNM
ncbi:PDZ and LIM domain protein 5a isoform X2 [Rhincodon typus]|uniref:PDZ and LIM domain protein 5a isoform X2 n=1 Tax=Rhincodon typus TaxID=259920 RepID=UPI00202DDC3E|nr:PDZ and LIM domain protein 5a isoform X2 [Rhincodon typus]